MRHVRTNAELEAFHRAGVGLIFNDFTSGPTAADNNRLHLASCRWVETMLVRHEALLLSDGGERPSISLPS